MAAAALSRRQTTQVCTQGRKKVKLIQKDYLDQLFFKKKKVLWERDKYEQLFNFHIQF